jgi:hypothetical protein
MFFLSFTTIDLSSSLGLWFKAPPIPNTCYYKSALSRLYVQIHHRLGVPSLTSTSSLTKGQLTVLHVHSTQVSPTDQNEKILSMVSYVTSGKSPFVTGTQPVQQFQEPPISSTNITSNFRQSIPFYSQLGLNRPPILPKVYTLSEELFAGRLWFSTWGL